MPRFFRSLRTAASVQLEPFGDLHVAHVRNEFTEFLRARPFYGRLVALAAIPESSHVVCCGRKCEVFDGLWL